MIKARIARKRARRRAREIGYGPTRDYALPPIGKAMARAFTAKKRARPEPQPIEPANPRAVTVNRLARKEEQRAARRRAREVRSAAHQLRITRTRAA